MSKGGGGRHRYPEAEHLPEDRRTKPALTALTGNRPWAEECDRFHGYTDSGVCSHKRRKGKPAPTATHRVHYYNERRKRNDSDYVCRECAEDFAKQHGIEVP